jgi:hypothetical protein
MPTGHRAAATLRQLLSEARDLCGEAQELSLGDAEQVALQRKYGEVTAITRISFAFRGSPGRKIRSWLRRADFAVRMATTHRGVSGNSQEVDLLNQLRRLIDAANVAVISRSKSPAKWAIFYSMLCQTSDRPRESNSGIIGTHRRFAARRRMGVARLPCVRE